MKRAVLASILAAIAVSLAMPATADAQKEKGIFVKKKRKKIKKYDFRGENVDGDVVRPGGFDINTRQWATHKSLIRIRQDFMHEIMKETEKKYNMKFGECTLFVGKKGLLRIKGHSGGWQFLPEEKRKEIQEPSRTIPRAHGGPIEDLFHAMKNDGTPCSNFPDAATPLTSFVLTGHLAMHAGVGKKLLWNVKRMKCTNMPEINRHVRREYRQGWQV